MSDEQIEARIKEMRDRFGGGAPSGTASAESANPGSEDSAGSIRAKGKGKGPRPGGDGNGGRPRIDWANATPEQIDQIKKRMKDRGMTDTQIDARIKQMQARAKSGEAASQ